MILTRGRVAWARGLTEMLHLRALWGYRGRRLGKGRMARALRGRRGVHWVQGGVLSNIPVGHGGVRSP